MKLVVTSDVHVHAHRVGSAGAGEDRLADGLSALRQTLAYAEAERCPWVFLGDLKQPKHVWPVEALNGCLAVLADFPQLTKVMLPGNHDALFGRFGSGLAPFRSVPSTTVLDEPIVANWAGGVVAAWPYGPRRLAELPAFFDRVDRTVAARRGDRVPAVLLVHAMLGGCLLGTAEAPGEGVAPETLRVGDLFDVALAGDVHKGQVLLAVGGRRPSRSWRPWTSYAAREGQARLTGAVTRRVRQGSGKGPGADVTPAPRVRVRAPGPWRGEVLVPGSPYQQGWGEAGEAPKGALLVDLATGAVDLLPVAAPAFVDVDLAGRSREHVLGFLADAAPWGDAVVRVAVDAAVLADRDVRAAVERARASGGARQLRAYPVRRAPERAAGSVDATMSADALVRAWVGSHPPPEGVAPAVAVRAGVELAADRGD